MKLHLPQVLLAAVLCTVVSNAGYAMTVDSVKNTDEFIAASGSHIAVDGDVTLTGSVSKNASIFVREGTMYVGDGSTKTTMTVTPESAKDGSLSIGGNNAAVILNNATYINGNEGHRAVGNADGSGRLELQAGSQMTDGDCEVFTIGTSYGSSTGQGNKVGRGDVVVSGGSSLVTNYGTFYMGDGSLTVEGTKDATSTVQMGYNGSGYSGRNFVTGWDAGTTSEIIVKSYATVNAYASNGYRVSYADNSTTNITVDGPGAEFTFGVTKKGATYAQIGNLSSNTKTNIDIKGGGKMNFDCTKVWLGNADSGNAVNINVADKDSTLDIDSSQFVIMHEGTKITNSGTVNVKADDDFYVYGGEINNKEGASLNATRINVMPKSTTDKPVINNDGTIVVDTYLVLYDLAEVNNSGSIEGGTWLNGNDAMLTALDGSTMQTVYLTKGTMLVTGELSMTGNLIESNASGMELVFTMDGCIDMNGNTISLKDTTLVLLVDFDITDGDTTTNFSFLHKDDLFENYSSKSFSGETEIVLRDSEGHEAVRMVAAIPEPTTATLSLLALAGLAARRRRK